MGQSTSGVSNKKGKRKHSISNIDTPDGPLTKIKKKDNEDKSDRSSGDSKTLKMIKDVFKGKYKKDKKSEAGKSGDWTVVDATPEPSTGDKTGGNIKTPKVDIEKGLVKTAEVITVTAGIRDSCKVTRSAVNTYKDNTDNKDDSKTDNVPNEKATESAKVTPGKKRKAPAVDVLKEDSITSDTKTDNVQNVSSGTESAIVTPGKKRKAPIVTVTQPTEERNITPNVATVSSGKSNDSNNSKSETSDLQEGEIEIYIPNKKYKKTPVNTSKSLPSTSTMPTPKAALFQFDNSKPPMAFVRKSLAKVVKTPTSATTPGSAKSRSEKAKRVSFDMKKNKAQGKLIASSFLHDTGGIIYLILLRTNYSPSFKDCHFCQICHSI